MGEMSELSGQCVNSHRRLASIMARLGTRKADYGKTPTAFQATGLRILRRFPRLASRFRLAGSVQASVGRQPHDVA